MIDRKDGRHLSGFLTLLLTLLWMGTLFILTCSKSLADLLFHFYIDFHVVAQPNWSSLLIFNPDDLQVPFYYVSKTGHFIGFGFLALLVSQWTSGRRAFGFALTYAILTEILQLYFGRDGRLVDVGIDFLGIGLFLFLRHLWTAERKTGRQSAQG
ncbi:MAG TPA: VanZ family protein [Sporolactobacillaceae bacterium]|nr:VanZ family protein [Sporolactobacillaceae bacterium]